MVDRILKAIKAWIDRREKRALGPVLVAPPPRPVSVEAYVGAFICPGCRRWSAAGWLIDGEPHCNLCSRPHVRARYGLERDEAPALPLRLAGDPR